MKCIDSVRPVGAGDEFGHLVDPELQQPVVVLVG